MMCEVLGGVGRELWRCMGGREESIYYTLFCMYVCNEKPTTDKLTHLKHTNIHSSPTHSNGKHQLPRPCLDGGGSLGVGRDGSLANHHHFSFL